MAQYNVDAEVAELLALGVTAETITGKAAVEKLGDEWIAWGRRGETQLLDLLYAARERAQLLDRIEFLATKIGEDGPARRAGADAKNSTLDGLRTLIAQIEKFARSKRIDLRTDAEKATARNTPATTAQVDYVVKLLARRTRTGEGGGFASTAGLYREDGSVDRAAVAALTKTAASNLIDSLTGQY